jgi:hypothetical protein
MKRGTRQAPAIAFLILLALTAAPAFGWGAKGHAAINRVAAQHIPKSMPSFLRSKAAIAQIAYLAPEPDRWRAKPEYALNNAQAPDHFIELECLEGLGDLPRGRYEFYKLLYDKRAASTDRPSDYYLPENVGLQPYITMEIFERLRIAFRDYRKMKAAHQPTESIERDAIFYAGWLGHYVADGSQPLHTTLKHDGWIGDNPETFTTKPGIHFAFETAFIDRNIDGASFSGMVHAPEQVADPFADYQKYLRASYALVDKVYEFDKAKAFDGAGTPEAIHFTEERLAAGCQMLLNLWYTAWMTSTDVENASKY